MSYLKIFDDLSNISSSNEKLEYLREADSRETESGSTVLKRIFEYMYDPKMTFGIKKIPEYTPHSEDLTEFAQGGLFAHLDLLSSRTYTGNEAIRILKSILSSANEPRLIEKVIKKDAGCGISKSTLRKVYGKDFIPKVPVMLASSMNAKNMEKITYPAYAQIKYDGARVIAHMVGGKVSLYTRNGKRYFHLTDLEKDLRTCMSNGEYIDAELLFRDETNPEKFLDRKTSNGLANKSLQGTLDMDTAKRANIIAWDIYTPACTTQYINRLALLHGMKEDPSCRTDSLVIADNKVINSPEEAQEYFKLVRGRGEEGLIIKNTHSLWADKRSRDLVKMKDVLEADMVIVGWHEGTGKYSGMLGALEVESRDGGVNCRVGTGFSDNDRKTITKDVIGSICEVNYNEEISSKSREVRSLFLPVFVELRPDKNQADII